MYIPPIVHRECDDDDAFGCICDDCTEDFEGATTGCDMCGAHIDDPCDCFDSQGERRYRHE